MGNNPSAHKGPRVPVESMPWAQAVFFCDCLTSALGAKVTLPSESEWEYACRANTSVPFFFGDRPVDELKEYAWYFTNAECRTQVVGTREANPWGLYDIYGNVGEWCSDVGSITYPPGSAFARQGFPQVVAHPTCGGNACSSLVEIISATCRLAPLGRKDEFVGFRIVVK